MSKIRTVHYKCQECGAEDSERIFENESPQLAINCWSCHAGRKFQNPVDQYNAKEGMILVTDEQGAPVMEYAA